MSFPISHIQSLILKRLAAARPVPRKTAVPQEYYESLAFHATLQIGEFTFDTTFDRIFKLDGKFVYVLGSSAPQYDEEMVDPVDERFEDFEFVSLWCYDTRDGKYRRFEQRWQSGEAAEEDDVHLCTTHQMTLYKTDLAFDTWEAMLESENPKVFGLPTHAWDSYTREIIAHDG